MARVSVVGSDDEAGPKAPSVRGKSDEKRDHEEDKQGEQEDEDGGEESEYEIEAILDAKRGAFPEGRIGYFVKWKGYPDSENSWVDELDAGNADNLITEYWKTHPGKKKAPPRKSMDSKTPKRSRKSLAAEETSDAESAATKKRGRKSQARAESDQDNNGSIDDRIIKKQRKARKSDVTREDSMESALGNMEKYMTIPSWEDIVQNVDTVEQLPDGKLMMYFTLNDGQRIVESSELCKTRFPQKILNFYESNLRWRSAEGVNATS
ncbi:hypothetical protein BD779DRAFT_1627750 [Infundibulicybe gibba]|nr:hypothetical protein BD779DRAFT_1627750 [Infundibulicybe gibba]